MFVSAYHLLLPLFGSLSHHPPPPAKSKGAHLGSKGGGRTDTAPPAKRPPLDCRRLAQYSPLLSLSSASFAAAAPIAADLAAQRPRVCSSSLSKGSLDRSRARHPLQLTQRGVDWRRKKTKTKKSDGAVGRDLARRRLPSFDSITTGGGGGRVKPRACTPHPAPPLSKAPLSSARRKGWENRQSKRTGQRGDTCISRHGRSRVNRGQSVCGCLSNNSYTKETRGP